MVDADFAQCHRRDHRWGGGAGGGCGGEQALEEFESQAIERWTPLFQQVQQQVCRLQVFDDAVLIALRASGAQGNRLDFTKLMYGLCYKTDLNAW